MEKLRVTRATLGWWSQAPEFDTALYAHYQRYVNCYEQFRDESERKTGRAFQRLRAKKNPYVSTSDSASHAVAYALGEKAEMNHGVLRPTYSDSSAPTAFRAKHPKTGYVEIIFHELDELARKKPMFLSMLHAARKLAIKDRTLNERETTFIGSIGRRHIVHREVVRYPSFNVAYNKTYHSKRYGIESGQSYSAFKRSLTTKLAASSMRGSTLPKRLEEHYARKLEQKAKKLASKRGGFIVYLSPEGLLRAQLPTTQLIRDVRKLNQEKDLAESFHESLGLFHRTTQTSYADCADGSVEPAVLDASCALAPRSTYFQGATPVVSLITKSEKQLESATKLRLIFDNQQDAKALQGQLCQAGFSEPSAQGRLKTIEERPAYAGAGDDKVYVLVLTENEYNAAMESSSAFSEFKASQQQLHSAARL